MPSHPMTAQIMDDTPLDQELEPGTIIDDYEVISKLGSGAMAIVYLAEQTDLGRKVALKVLKSSLAQNEEYVSRFFNEARAAASLSHPNIIQAYKAGETEDGTFAERQSERACLGEGVYVAFGGACRLFDLHRVEDAVVLYEDVDLGTGFVAIEPKTGFFPAVPASFEQFADDMGFEHRAAHGSVRQRFWRGPSRKIAAKPRIREIELWRLDDP